MMNHLEMEMSQLVPEGGAFQNSTALVQIIILHVLNGRVIPIYWLADIFANTNTDTDVSVSVLRISL